MLNRAIRRQTRTRDSADSTRSPAYPEEHPSSSDPTLHSTHISGDRCSEKRWKVSPLRLLTLY